jgi:hypothetical protein
MKSSKAAASFLPLVAGAWALSSCTPVVTGASSARVADANPITAGPQIGRCHMGGCGWFDIRSFEVVRETSDGALIRLDSRDGSSDHSGGSYPASSRGVKIDWGPYSKDGYVFCSSRLPAVIDRAETGAGWEAYRLDVISPSGASQSVTNLYNHVCNNGVDMEAEGAAERLGYRPVQADASGDFTIPLASPEAIFDHLGR